MGTTADTDAAARGGLWYPEGPSVVALGDNLDVLAGIPDESFSLVYADPPFNTGRERRLNSVRAVRDAEAGRVGFGGNAYETIRTSAMSYDDAFADYWGFLAPRLAEARRVLAADGTLYLHLDCRESHYAKVLLDGMFGRDCFINEIIWAYDFGGRAAGRWPAKHDNILMYAKDPDGYYFDSAAVDREPYMAPGLAGPEKAARGKLPTDVWWHTIVPTSGAERTGYPTQKPEGVLRRIVAASCPEGGWVLDMFAGSGTTGAVAAKLGRRHLMVDDNPEAFEVMRKRLGYGTLMTPVAYRDGRPGGRQAAGP